MIRFLGVERKKNLDCQLSQPNAIILQIINTRFLPW
jgi:hypothetical protein